MRERAVLFFCLLQLCVCVFKLSQRLKGDNKILTKFGFKRRLQSVCLQSSLISPETLMLLRMEAAEDAMTKVAVLCACVRTCACLFVCMCV